MVTKHYPIARAAKRVDPILDISDKFDTSRTVHNSVKVTSKLKNGKIHITGDK